MYTGKNVCGNLVGNKVTIFLTLFSFVLITVLNVYSQDRLQQILVGDVFQKPVREQEQISLKGIEISASFTANGQIIPLAIDDCNGDDLLDVFIPFSNSEADRPSRIQFTSKAFPLDQLPKLVELQVLSTAEVGFIAYDAKGNVVEKISVDASTKQPQPVRLQSETGVASIDVIGEEICINAIGFTPSQQEQPDVPTAESDCISVGDVYQEPQQGLSSVNLRAVDFYAAVTADGQTIPLNIFACTREENLGIVINSGEKSAEKSAMIVNPDLCEGRAPQQLQLTILHEAPIELRAFDDNGNQVDTAADNSPRSGKRIFTLTSQRGIRMVEFVGEQFCVQQVCWDCEFEPEDEPQPEPADCIEINRFYQEPQEVKVVDLGTMEIIPAVDGNGQITPFQIQDCSDDGNLDIFVPWSGTSAQNKASILISDTLCKGLPNLLTLTVRNFDRTSLRAYNANGALVSTAAALPTDGPQRLTLTSRSGIQRVEIVGSEICIEEICWSCTIPEQPEEEREWISLIEDAKPGSPVSVQVEESNRERTVFRYRIPGVWLKPVEYGGQTFTEIELPAVQGLRGVGFEKGKEWFQFPRKHNYPLLDSARYRNSVSIRTRKPVFPEELKEQERFPQSGKELAELGIDPTGARPMVPQLAALLAISPSGFGENESNVKLGKSVLESRELELEHPLVPAGYSGLDQASQPRTNLQDFVPPEIIDMQFYEEFEGEYQGDDRTGLSVFNRAGAMTVSEARIPLLTVHKSRAVTIHDFVEIAVEHPAGVHRADVAERTKQIGWDAWINKPAVINGQALLESYLDLGLEILPIRFANYLILTAPEYEDDLQEFIDWKESKGLNVSLYTVGNSDTDDFAPDRSEIDSFLEKYYEESFWKSIYVLIVGDVDEIPAGRSSKIIASPDASNGDSDHVYEVIDSDLLASLYVGRLSVNSSEELNAQLEKILAYERGEIPGNWPTLATLLANSENDDGSRGVSTSFPSKYAQAVNDIADYGSYNDPPTFEVLHAGADDFSTVRADNDDAIDAVNQGRGHVLYRGHGSDTSWLQGWDGSSSFGDAFDLGDELDSLENSVFPIVYSIACVNNRLRTEDSLGEAWMSMEDSGSVAFWSASVNSYTTENHERAKGVFRAIYESDISSLGPALAEAERISLGQTGGGSGWDNNTFCYLLLGDPEMGIRRDPIFKFTLIDPIIKRINDDLLIQLFDQNRKPMVGTLANLEFTEGSANGFTTTDGTIVFPDVNIENIVDLNIFPGAYPWWDIDIEDLLPDLTPTPAVPDPIWVDDDNNSGIEDGSEQYPYNTIAEAMNLAVTHTIRVRSGNYNESITMKDGVQLIGSGAEDTIIDAGGSDPVVSCLNVGPQSAIRGFTLQNGSVGILCTSSSPIISENIISNIALNETSGDGIRLTDSSPSIEYNVIAGVGGMGIRGQGDSEPTIINNTIFDNRYYAGIGFAALNIGAVSPIIKNNIIMRGNGNAVSGILWNATATPQISYNNVYDVGSPGGGVDGKYAVSEGGSWQSASGGPGAISTDPLFAGDGSGNYSKDGSFYLLPLSPCIDAGDPAAQYNDLDGSRNDMGAYGGQRREVGGTSHGGSGFLFTSVGRIPTTQIIQSASPGLQGLANVSEDAAEDFHIPQYYHAPFGGNLWLRGLFGADDPVDYYQIIATPLDGGDPIVLNDNLTKTKFTINPDGSVARERIRMGPLTIDGQTNLYRLNDEGNWSQEDLRMIWNTSGLMGQYELTYRAFQETSDGSIAEVSLPDNEFDDIVLWIDNSNLDVRINEVLYSDSTGLEECEDIQFVNDRSQQLVFDITAFHPNGFLRSVSLDAHWGHNRSGGKFLGEQYRGSNDGMPPVWEGYLDEQLPPLLPRNSAGDVVPWEDCAYRFQLVARGRTTNGFHYIQYSEYNVHHSVEVLESSALAGQQNTPCLTCDQEAESSNQAMAVNASLSPVDPPSIAKASVASTNVKYDGNDAYQPYQAIGQDAADFVDTWYNVNPNTLGLTKLQLDTSGGNILVHGYGQCHPTDCDWGEISVPFTGNPFTAVYEFSFKTATLTIELLDYNTLHVSIANDYFEDDPRDDFTAEYTLDRGTIWVDDDNTSGTEDGSRSNPYNTILEGIGAASAGRTVRVLPGVYPETVEMKNEVNLIGSGAEETFIEPGLDNTGVFCQGINQNTVMSGFTITQADVGIYCVNSDLEIRETTIINLKLDSTASDGIRLDSSSPSIRYNLIAHVGGMGIRGQGDSEPEIINNTIYDYRYYAGIGFAAENIGAVEPTVMNNIIVRGNGEPVGGILWSAPADLNVSYNNVYDPANTTGGGSYYAVHDGTSWNEVPGGPGELRVDPIFMDANNDYFELSSLSLCIDAGNPMAVYNDTDGSRSDMGAFGGERLESSVSGHSGQGFLFTSIGKTPISEIVSDPSDPLHGLLDVSESVADSLRIPEFDAAAFGGKLFLRGLFGVNDDVDYYQILYKPFDSSDAPTPINDPLNKVKYNINEDGTISRTRIQMGPQTVDGVSNLYLLNKSGYWSFTDLRMIWNTNGLRGKYEVTVKAYQEASDGTLQEVTLPPNELDHFTLRINNEPVVAHIESVAYADGASLAECEKINLPRNGNENLVFRITASHPDGFLRRVLLDCFWGNNRDGGDFLNEHYTGMNDSMAPVWNGYSDEVLAPMQPTNASGDIVEWNNCAYRFRLLAYARITNGVRYIGRSGDNLHHSIAVGQDVGIFDWSILENSMN